MLRSWAYVPGPGCSSRWRPRLGPRLERTQALCGPCVSRSGIYPSVCGRRTRAELHIRDIRPRMLSHLLLLAGELLVRTHAAPSHVALFADMVLSIAPFLASTSTSYVRLTSRFARHLHIINVPKLHSLRAKVPRTTAERETFRSATSAGLGRSMS